MEHGESGQEFEPIIAHHLEQAEGLSQTTKQIEDHITETMKYLAELEGGSHGDVLEPKPVIDQQNQAWHDEQHAKHMAEVRQSLAEMEQLRTESANPTADWQDLQARLIKILR